MLTAGDVLQLSCVTKKKKVQRVAHRALHVRVQAKFPTIIRKYGKRTRALVRWIAMELDHYKLEPLVTPTDALRRYCVSRVSLTAVAPRTCFARTPYGRVEKRMQSKLHKYRRTEIIEECFKRHIWLDVFLAYKRKRAMKQYSKNERKALITLNSFDIELF